MKLNKYPEWGQRYRDYRYAAFLGILYLFASTVVQLVRTHDVISILCTLVVGWVLADLIRFAYYDFKDSTRERDDGDIQG